MQKAAFLDLDQTLYNGYLFYEWLKFLEERSLVSLADIARMDVKQLLLAATAAPYTKQAEEVDHTIAKILEGKEVEGVFKATKDFVSTIKSNFYDYTQPLLDKLRDGGHKIILVTNEPDFLAEMIKGLINADDALGIDFEIKEGTFTGKMTNDLFSKFGKANIVKEYAEKNGIILADSIAIGDSEGDIEMLKIVGKGILINPNKENQELIEKTSISVCTRENILSLL